MIDILPLFSSHYSLSSGGLLTLEEAGKTKPGNPESIVDLALARGLKCIVLIDTTPGGFLEAYKHLSKAGIQLIFGLKIPVCADMGVKDDESRRGESSVVISMRDTSGYPDLIRLWNRAATNGFYYHARLDWKTLNDLWSRHLVLGLPFWSSFLARNATTTASIVPDLPIPANEVWAFKEVDSRLPNETLIARALERYAMDSGVKVVPSKTIYYGGTASFKAYMLVRALHERASFDNPRVNDLASDRFSLESWKDLMS